MSTLDTVEVLAINVPDRIAVRDDDVIGDIRCFLDEDGDEIDTEEDAVQAVVEWRTHGWSCLLLSDYETRRSS